MRFTGERQVGETLNDIRPDHIARYEFAASRLDGKRVIDLGAGVGYGSHILGKRASYVYAIEKNAEAVEFAEAHYNSAEHVKFTRGDITKGKWWEPCGPFDAAVAFEIIEHVKNPGAFLRKIRAPVLYASVPNQLVWPYSADLDFHHRHYTPHQFEELLNSHGFEVREWYGQRGENSDLEPNIQGRTLVVVAEKIDEPKGGTAALLPSTKPSIGTVAIVAMGGSSQAYVHRAAPAGGAHALADNVWAINAMGCVILHDVLFAMDDLKLQEARAKANPGGLIDSMLKWLPQNPKFYTSKVYPGYPGAIEYPLEEVSRHFGCSLYFNSTVPYALALAIYQGANHVTLYGCDFAWPNHYQREKGRGCLEYWVGIASCHGTKVEVPRVSTLMDACVPEDQYLYGYDAEKVYWGDEGKLVREPKELPTVEEIEARYDKRPAKEDE